MLTRDRSKSRSDRVELVTITTLDRARIAENKGFVSANTPKIVYLLIPSCGSRAKDGSVLIFLATSVARMDQMSKGIGLGVWTAIGTFQRLAS
jgi:hypothetical protein